ncbi:MAG: homoserine kinase [Cyclobacteriaceae bacterium]|nr:homoserine kinase [Cyclobacteriaceae bacterium]MCB0498305.1 homoserine kinase [Cyclobacteriaceae bacterium]MCB9239029.1 homoserine kinase [Flammeovirgaceae bacterium]MCO5270751.1 homoserine kinase [Cyclobacteriaceae bacterium]MCW5903511.1 homoserine kinase [Cyclobacteriaceae bacterium]
MKNSIRVYSPASVSNVTCGFDILGFALEKPGDIILAEQSTRPGVRIKEIIGGSTLPLDPKENVASVAAQALVNHINPGFGIDLTVHKGIKPGSGIGSSASSAAAAAFAANQLAGAPIKDTLGLIPFAMQGELLASGAFHADNVAPALLGGFIIVRSNDPLDVVQLGTPSELYAVVVHPDVQIKTSESRKLLPSLVPLKSVVAQTGNIAGLVAGLLQHDYNLIGRSMHDGIVEPARAHTIPGFRELKSAAIQAGALGAGISGSGPSVFALCWGGASAGKVHDEMRSAYGEFNIKFDSYISAINKKGTIEIMD